MKYCSGTFNKNTEDILELFNKFPFELSDFQKWAIKGIVENHATKETYTYRLSSSIHVKPRTISILCN